MTEYNYNFARRAGDISDYERIIESEGPTDECGTMGEPDMFKLEHSGWCRHVEFMPNETLK